MVETAGVREALDLGPESEILPGVKDGVRLETRAAALRRVQQHMKQFARPGESTVDEFLAERQEQARREKEDLDR